MWAEAEQQRQWPRYQDLETPICFGPLDERV